VVVSSTRRRCRSLGLSQTRRGDLMVDTLASFGRRVEGFADDLGGQVLRVASEQVGKAAKGDATEAVRGDLGDESMSHWRRKSPIPIGARYDLRSDHQGEGLPTPRARGPWRVLEDGRSAGAATDVVQVGRVRKNGTRRAKSRGRNQGGSRGRGTWTAAVKLMADRTPGRVNKELGRSMSRHFGR